MKNYILSLCALILAQSAFAQEEGLNDWYSWEFFCYVMSEDENNPSLYQPCLSFVLQAPNSLGVTSWAGEPIELYWPGDVDLPTIRYRVTHYASDASQCGQIRTVYQGNITNGDVNGFGKTAAFYLLNRC